MSQEKVSRKLLVSKALTPAFRKKMMRKDLVRKALMPYLPCSQKVLFILSIIIVGLQENVRI
jgi:hypothetical protein